MYHYHIAKVWIQPIYRDTIQRRSVDPTSVISVKLHFKFITFGTILSHLRGYSIKYIRRLNAGWEFSSVYTLKWNGPNAFYIKRGYYFFTISIIASLILD